MGCDESAEKGNQKRGEMLHKGDANKNEGQSKNPHSKTAQSQMNVQSTHDIKDQNIKKLKGQLAGAQEKIRKCQQIIEGQKRLIKQQSMEMIKMQQEVKRAKQSTNQNAQQVVLIQMQKYQQLQRQKKIAQKQQEIRLSQMKRLIQQKQISIQATVKSRCQKQISLIRHEQGKKYDQLKIRFDNRQQELTQLKTQNTRIKQNAIKIQAGAANNAGKISDYELLISKLQQQLEQEKSLNNEKHQQLQLMRFNQLFQNQIFSGKQFYKQYLANTIQERYNRRLVKTRHLYSFDQNNKANFHKSIDEIHNIIVIIRLSNGFYVAGFTQSPFIPKVASNGDALLISLTNKRIFYLLEQNRRGITYDDYYIIFGNSELRLRSQQSKVFSNFGISNGYFSSRGETINVLLGEGTNRQVDIQYYEIYQVIFEGI